MNSSHKSTFFSRRTIGVAIAITALLFAGVAANAAGTVNGLTENAFGKDYHRYHVICVNVKTKKITYGGDANTSGCNSPSFTVVSSSGLAAAALKGSDGVNGKDGINGKNGVDGKDGKTLWNGIKDPEVTWGAPGDMYINATTQTLFGPKNLDGSWPAGVSMVGPRGNQGLIGLTGPAGPQGPGGSGPAGAAGATGPAGAVGATGPAGAVGAAGANGADGQGPVYLKTNVNDSNVTTAGVEAISLSLNAGSYLLTYSAVAYATTSKAEFVYCGIENSNVNAGRSVYVNNVSDFNNRKFMTEQKTVTLASSGTVKVYCKSYYENNTVSVTQQIFTALKVSSATIQP